LGLHYKGPRKFHTPFLAGHKSTECHTFAIDQQQIFITFYRNWKKEKENLAKITRNIDFLCQFNLDTIQSSLNQFPCPNLTPFNQPKWLVCRWFPFNRTPTMAGVTTFAGILAFSVCSMAGIIRLRAEVPSHDQIGEVTSLIIDQIDSNWMYGGSYVRLFTFCKQSDSVFEQLMRDLIHAKPLTVVIGDRGFSFPLQTTIQKSTFNVMLVDGSATLMVRGHSNPQNFRFPFSSFQEDVLHQLQTQKRSSIWRAEAPTLVVLTRVVHFVYQDFEVVFERFTRLEMYNTAIVFWTSPGGRHQIMTYNPFLEIRLENKTTVPTFQDVFYDKYSNLHGNALRITQFDDPPRSFVLNKTYISGTDGKALALLCKKLNASYRVIGPKGPKELAYLNTIQDLYNGTADMNFNMRLFLSSNYLNSSVIPVYPHDIDSFVILVPKSGLYPPFQNLLHPIKLASRFVLTAVYLIVTIIWFLFLRYYRRVRPRIVDVLLDTLRLQLSTPLPRDIVNIHERLLISGFMVYGFIIISGYQTILISFLMSPRYQPDLQSLGELNRTAMDLYAPKSINTLRGRILDMPLHNRVFETSTTVWTLKNFRLAGTEFGYITTDREARFFLTTNANIQHSRPLMHMIDEGILFSPSSYHLEQHSPYEIIISNWICRFREAGLYRQFNLQSFHESKRGKKLKTEEPMMPVTKEMINEKASVKFFEVLPAFLLLGFGCLIAGVVFIVEVIYFRVMQKAKEVMVWQMRACSQCGAPRLLRSHQSGEVDEKDGVLPWVD
jgi:hypothetical protein